MSQVANSSDIDKRELFKKTARSMHISAMIIEKDFWVCLFLDLLFHQSPDAAHFSFKGGTSLSKGYNLTRRFSEDIDLILDWRCLGYSKDEPESPRSNTQQDSLNKEINGKAAEYLARTIMPDLQNLSNKCIGARVQLHIDDHDSQTICIVYPCLFKDFYLVPEIRLEIGPLAAWTPFTETIVRPYVADRFPQRFGQAGTVVRTIQVKRTFWEKALILHKEAHRTGGKVPERYARHYYDLYMLSQTSAKGEAFADTELLNTVALFNQKFYHSSWARYEEATLRKMKLVPSADAMAQLSDDYAHMQEMIFGDKPSFETIMMGLEDLQSEIHRLGAATEH